jgi:16S rRNA (cytosine1402-N4)-methyltransferase
MENLNTIHLPVMPTQVISALSPEPGKKYIDATIGGGGHTALLLEKGSHVLGFDQDQEAIVHVKKRFNGHNMLQLVEANFIGLKAKAISHQFDQVDGALFDLGVSSLQLDTPSRGFSFNHEAPLDMRMSMTSAQTAADLINSMAEDELYELLVNNAQEEKARDIARAIVTNRPVTTTKQLANLVMTVYGNRRGHLHPATKTFQAIRIAVNQELKIIKPAIKDAFSLLKIGGKLAVISFHEGEDRIIKRTFLELVNEGVALATGKQPIVPDNQEIAVNQRARSAKLRIIERLK